MRANGGISLRAAALALVIVALTAVMLYINGRSPLCPCGVVHFWVSDPTGPENSQQIADWYTLSHIIHGFLFFGALWLVARRWPPQRFPIMLIGKSRSLHLKRRVFVGSGDSTSSQNALGARLVVAVMVEAGWELLENSPVIIDRYRAGTIATGYTGDSILNSVCDIAFMTLGFIAASRLPVWVTLALAVSFELIALWAIRDNLTLNVLMLIYPLAAIRDWQAGV